MICNLFNVLDRLYLCLTAKTIATILSRLLYSMKSHHNGWSETGAGIWDWHVFFDVNTIVTET